jgi:hypothetical protein
MGFYENRILPHLVHLSMRQNTFLAYRRRLVPAAQGRVLEIGVGSGLNLPLYTDAADHVVGSGSITRHDCSQWRARSIKAALRRPS